MEASPASEDLRRAQEGDPAALARLWREHRRWIAVVLLAHMPDDGELEDLLQDVAVKMVEKLGELRDPLRLRPWLRSVAVHTARSAGRRTGLRRRLLRRLDPRHLEVADERASSVEKRLLTHLTAQRALEAARRLPEIYREPLLLRALREMSQKDIAHTLSLPETTVETRLARARRMVREQLETEDPPARIPQEKRGRALAPGGEWTCRKSS